MAGRSAVTRLLHSLEKLSLPLVTAESCTGGALASALTGRPQAPGLCLGGITSYSPLFKHAVLGVPAEIIRDDGPGEVSPECARAMARGAMECSGLLQKDRYKEFKYGQLAKEARGIGLSTTGFLDNLPEGEPEERRGEVWIGCDWVFQGAQGSRVERLNVNDVRAHPPADNIRIDQEDANRNERKETVVARALEIALEVVQELETRGQAHSGQRANTEGEVLHAQDDAERLINDEMRP